MYMMSIRRISICVAMAFIAIAMVACKNDTDTVLTKQQSSIESYLTGGHKPRLIEESKVGESLDENPQFYTRWDMDIYRYISTYYDEGREDRAEIYNGTKFDMVYTAYIFNNGAPTVADMFATNDPDSIEQLKQAGLNTSYEWSTEPMSITLGSSSLVGGLETALEGCREGDSVEIYLTYIEAYGNDYIGKVPSKSSVVWFIDIVDVKE